MKNFEIHDLTTNEILTDNLTFEELPKLFKAYADFYPDHEITVCQRKCNDICIPVDTEKDFKTQWFMLVDAYLCNFY